MNSVTTALLLAYRRAVTEERRARLGEMLALQMMWELFSNEGSAGV